MKENNYVGSHPTEAQLLLALDGELEQAEAKEISLHVGGCAVCRAQWERWKRISERIHEHHQRILKVRAIPARAQSSGVRVRAIAALSGIAAAVACLVWLGGRTSPPASAPQHTTAPVQVVAAEPRHASPSAEASARRAVSRHKRQSAAVRESNSFLALPFSDSALPLGDATVVRVQMGVEELQSTGLPILDARPGAAVEADVLMGIDGLPRGIRLVHLVQ